MEQRVKNDVYYVENVSFMLDLKIIFLTAASVIKSKNINRNNDEKQKGGKLVNNCLILLTNYYPFIKVRNIWNQK